MLKIGNVVPECLVFICQMSMQHKRKEKKIWYWKERKLLRHKRKMLGNLGKYPLLLYLVILLSAVGGFLFGYDTGVIAGA